MRCGQEDRKADGRGVRAPHPEFLARHGSTRGWYAWASQCGSIVFRIERVSFFLEFQRHRQLWAHLQCPLDMRPGLILEVRLNQALG